MDLWFRDIGTINFIDTVRLSFKKVVPVCDLKHTGFLPSSLPPFLPSIPWPTLNSGILSFLPIRQKRCSLIVLLYCMLLYYLIVLAFFPLCLFLFFHSFSFLSFLSFNEIEYLYQFSLPNFFTFLSIFLLYCFIDIICFRCFLPGYCSPFAFMCSVW